MSGSGRGAHEVWYLEEVEGSRSETWMTGSSLMSWMILFCPQEYSQKIHVYIFIRSVSGRGYFLTGDLEDRVIIEVIDVLGRPQGSYSESFVSLSSFLAEL